MVKIRYLALLVAALAWLGLSAAPASASTGMWAIQGTPGISAQDSVSCWSSSGCLSVSPTGAMKWNGSHWTAIAGRDVNSVSCTSSAYCIAVGTSSGKATAWRWNGKTWASLAAYNTAAPVNNLYNVKCASSTSCEAVGSHSSSAFTYPLAEFWNGKKWTHQSTSGAPQGTLYAIACEAAGKCEAVGTQPDSASGGASLAMGLSGSKWVTQTTPPLPNEYGSPQGQYAWGLDGLSCYSSGCVAVGNQTYCVCSPESSGDLLLSEVWNGSKWALLTSKLIDNGGDENWAAVHCTSASSCLAVGYYTDDNEAQPNLTLVSSWNGTAWSQVSSPNGTDTTDFPGNGLNGLACTSSICRAVGYQTTSSGTTALAESN